MDVLYAIEVRDDWKYVTSSSVSSGVVSLGWL
jgi:hypothetical protein